MASRMCTRRPSGSHRSQKDNVKGFIKAFFSAIAKRVNEQPVASMALVKAGIAMLICFGLKWTVEQVAAVMLFSEAILAWWTYGKVTPVASPTLPGGTTVNEGTGAEVTVPTGTEG